MAFKIVFQTKRGNTTVEIEDLARTGLSCSHCNKDEYPGQCEHCGKLHIRYLAHVKQDVADTLARTSEDAEDRLERTDEEIAALGIALMDGKSFKEIKVGCVCVAKYLVDCGVDAGLAERLQFEVNRVTSYLQQIAAVEAAKAPERVEESLRRADIVKTLADRKNKVTSIRIYNNPNLKDPAAVAEVSLVRTEARNTYDEAVKRFQRENHGWNLYYKPAPTAETLLAHLDAQIKHFEAKLRPYVAGASFVA